MEQNKTKENEFIDLPGLTLYYLKYWKWILLSIAVCVTLTYFYLKSTPSVYETKSNILIKTEDSRSSAMNSTALKSLGFGGLSASENIDNEIEVISSHSLMKQMVYELELYKNYELVKFPFDQTLYNNSPVTIDVSRSFIDTLNQALSFKVEAKNNRFTISGKYGKTEFNKIDTDKLPYTLETPIGSFTFNNNAVPEKSSYKLNISISGLDPTAELYMKKITVAPVTKKASVIGLTVEDHMVQRAKDALNKLVILYNEDALSDKNKQAQNTADFIRERVDTIAIELWDIEAAIEAYKNENNIIDIKTEASVAIEKMMDLREKSVEYEIQQSLLGMVENHMARPENRYALLPVTTGMPVAVGDIIQNYNNLLLERSRLMKNASESNPTILSLNDQIDLLRENLEKSIENTREEMKVIKSDWASTERDIETRLSRIPKQEREFLDLRRQQEIKSEIYIFLLQKLQEAELTLASNTPKAKVVDAAYTLTKPVAPRRMLTLFLGFMAGIIIPIVIIILKDMFKPNLSDLEELEKHTNIPILGEICKDRSGNKIVVTELANTSVAELFRLIRTNLQFVLTKKEEKVILITSSISGEGKSFFAVNLASSLSLIKGKKIVIVGLDIRNPKLTEYLSLKTTTGITTYLADEEYRPEDIIMPLDSIRPNLYFIPAGPIPPNPSELLLNDRLEYLFEYLRERFDYILVDTAPVGMVSDTFALARISDATIYLYRADYTNKSYLKMANNFVNENKLKKTYLVMNGTRTKSAYGYGYGEK